MLQPSFRANCWSGCQPRVSSEAEPTAVICVFSYLCLSHLPPFIRSEPNALLLVTNLTHQNSGNSFPERKLYTQNFYNHHSGLPQMTILDSFQLTWVPCSPERYSSHITASHFLDSVLVLSLLSEQHSFSLREWKCIHSVSTSLTSSAKCSHDHHDLEQKLTLL